jgi:hypothetical protein
MNAPLIAARLLIPSARPRWFWGKASVRIGAEFAIRKAPPMPWPTRIKMSHSAPEVPSSQVIDNKTEKNEKTAKPSVNIRTRPYMSPIRPKLTSSTAVQTMKPINIQRR